MHNLQKVKLGIPFRPEMGKQTIEAKEVYSVKWLVCYCVSIYMYFFYGYVRLGTINPQEQCSLSASLNITKSRYF